ncbi:MerR family transcriptional regulator [Shimazuella sp. AN120528]|uniref:MerR family transcriptional regulator n=1 Tax=Shimazuella soli TaxID=1892854 RepID=UPI001F0D5AED|nr:MerR family transcriptional regulator [Shimazuella soli]MCH5585605.1 MerR family transcriptional regulator [Shimazuella soli]
MGLTIGQIAENTGLSIHTLRYYEKEGIMPHVKRNESGNRIYEPEDVEVLKFICCLKETGMPVKEIKKFVSLLMMGEQTIEDRITILLRQKENVQSQVDQLLSYIQMLDGKVEFYKSILESSKKEKRV